ncbi:MAG: hypothetical protein WDM96_06355 [Lacunisphaera sp.]
MSEHARRERAHGRGRQRLQQVRHVAEDRAGLVDLGDQRAALQHLDLAALEEIESVDRPALGNQDLAGCSGQTGQIVEKGKIHG